MSAIFILDPSRHPRGVILLAEVVVSTTCTSKPFIISIIHKIRTCRDIFDGDNNCRDETTVLDLVNIAVGGAGMIYKCTVACLHPKLLLAR